ncbi:Ig-like domain-containing protein, partial [Franconibacter helveticus]
AAGNSTSVPHSVTLDAAAATLPTLLINAVFDDNYINAQESSQPLTITGVAFNVEEGRTVTLTLNDTLYTATVGPLGEWSTTIPADVISALADGVYTLIGRVSDASGNETEAGGGFTVDTVATLTIDPVATDDLINLTESQADVTVSGSASTADVGEEVTVTLNGESWTTLIQDDGSWSTLIPSTSLSTMLDGLYVLKATFTDVAGNTASPLREITLDRNVTAVQAVQAFSTLDVDSASPQAWPGDTPHNQSYSIGGVMVTQADGGLVQGASLAAGGEEAVFTLREPQPPEPQWSFSQLGLEGATGETGSLALSFDDVMQQKSVSQQSLTINASQNDSVTLINSPEGMWDFSGQRAVEGQLFDVWHNSALSQGDPLGDVLIEQTVHVRLQ